MAGGVVAGVAAAAAGGVAGAPSREQVSFASPFPEDPLTAIIGGGNGLVCAHELARRGLRSVVFDTGEHGVGGRLATRSSNDGSLKGAPPGLVFDHAAQFFTATHPAFKAMVDEWERDGVVCRWDGPVGTLENGAFAPDDSGASRYVARRGMRSLATHLAGRASRALKQERGGSERAVNLDALVEVRRPQWVSDARYTRHEGGEGWRLEGRGRDQGIFDVVVIAHNGKCANRLAAPMGAPAVHSQLKRLKLSANWALLVAFASPVPVPGGMEGAFVRGSDVLAWAGNNSAKLGLAGGPQCWTLFSTQEYGRANKVPQENVPPEVAARVTAEMLAAFERSLGLVQGSLPPVVYSRTQLWGAALPINSPRVGCIFDPAARAGVCGDWVLEGGSMQAAALSGAAMAERIDASRGRRPTDLADLAIGLTTPLKAAGGEEIGQFPGGQPPTPPAAQAAAPQRRQQAPKQRRGQQLEKGAQQTDSAEGVKQPFEEGDSLAGRREIKDSYRDILKDRSGTAGGEAGGARLHCRAVCSSLTAQLPG
ncbi:hypothetical protein ABPG77_008208 [Micractinium sp. CCAP 211/92]